MLKTFLIISAVVAWGMLVTGSTSAADRTTLLDQDMQTLGGEDVNLAEKYKGQVVLLVNVASKCGLTPQYEALQALHKKYADQGLAIVGVPCNQFGGQEPGTHEQIAEFCRANYGVEFDMLAKVDVNGDEACPLYKKLTSEESNSDFAGKISWNFEKFLFNHNGEVVERFNPRVKPESEEIVSAIERELTAKKAADDEPRGDAKLKDDQS